MAKKHANDAQRVSDKSLIAFCRLFIFETHQILLAQCRKQFSLVYYLFGINGDFLLVCCYYFNHSFVIALSNQCYIMNMRFG